MSDIHSILIVGFPCLEIAEFWKCPAATFATEALASHCLALPRQAEPCPAAAIHRWP